MSSETLEKVLNTDNQVLSEELEKVKNNPIYQSVMQNVKEEFFIDDRVHGLSHNERVVIYACIIGLKEGLSEEDLRLVLEASLYHDIGRGYDEKGSHGALSAAFIERNKEYIFPNYTDKQIDIIRALCNGHSVDDKIYESVAESYDVEDIKRFKKLLDVLKDADAIDRQRIHRYGRFDESYLRTKTSHEYIDFAKELIKEYGKSISPTTRINDVVKSNYEVPQELREKLLFDGEYYYLLRSLNKTDITNIEEGRGIVAKREDVTDYTTQDVMAQIKIQHKNTGLISMSEDPNVVLTYDRDSNQRFVLIKLSKEELENNEKVFSVGEYLFGVLNAKIEKIVPNAPEHVKKVLKSLDDASTVEQLAEILNDVDDGIQTRIVTVQQQYLSSEEQLEQSKTIAKCKALNYYGLMREIVRDEDGKKIYLSKYTGLMRNGFSSVEWLHVGKIDQEKIIEIPQPLLDALALLKQAEFQGKDKKSVEELEKTIIRMVSEKRTIDSQNYRFNYSNPEEMKKDLRIEDAYRITQGKISYRDVIMLQIAIRSIAEAVINKRTLTEELKKIDPSVDVDELLSDTYCINPHAVTRRNNKGSQFGKNISFNISEYGDNLKEAVIKTIIDKANELTNEKLVDIVEKGVESQELLDLLFNLNFSRKRMTYTGKNEEEFDENSKRGSKLSQYSYMAEAIIELYNWRRNNNILRADQRKLLYKRIKAGKSDDADLSRLYKALNDIQIDSKSFTQNEICAIIINIANEQKIGNVEYSELKSKNIDEMKRILLENQDKIRKIADGVSIDLNTNGKKRIDALKKELIDLGISEDFIERIHNKNLYQAKLVVEGYDFGGTIGRELYRYEKKALIMAVLSSIFTGKKSPCLLSRLIADMEKNGLSEQEAYGMIINMGSRGYALENGDYAYNTLLTNSEKSRKTIMNHRSQILTKVNIHTISIAIAKTLGLKEQDELIEELANLGIDREFLDDKNIKNLYMARRIVNDYDFKSNIGREALPKEKGLLIKLILDNAIYDATNKTLYSLVLDMEKIGLSPQEIYGMIINLAINGTAIEGKNYSYSNLLSNYAYCCQTIGQYKDEIKTHIDEEDMVKAVSNNLSAQEQEQIKQDLVDLGLDIGFINDSSIKNLYVAKKIVEEYNFVGDIGESIKPEEKKALIKAILDNGSLKKKQGTYILSLVHNLKKIGLSTQEVYGTIINSAINKTAIDVNGFGYSVLIMSPYDSCRKLAKYKERIKTKVTKGSINKAVSNSLSDSEEEQIRREILDMGFVDKRCIEKSNISDIYIAKKIVEGYDFSKVIKRDISKEEKGALITRILKPAVLAAGKGTHLCDFVCDFEKLGLNTQEIYGIIINSATIGKPIKNQKFSYSKVLTNKSPFLQKINQHKGSINTEVTEEAIEKALKKVKRSLKGTDLFEEGRKVGNGGSKVCCDVNDEINGLRQEQNKKLRRRNTK